MGKNKEGKELAVTKNRGIDLHSNKEDSTGGNNWHKIDWKKTIKEVESKQEKIVIAASRKEMRDVYRLQRELVLSESAIMLAIRKVIGNKGGKTAGVDKIIWKGGEQYYNAVRQLQKIVQNPRKYKAQPLRRVEIPKPGSKDKRKLGIPTMMDRAVQAVYHMAVDPVVESSSDKNSFGFRKNRSTHDAVSYARTRLDKKTSPNWILEADISKCFDKINHEFLMKYTPIVDKCILRQWLESGVMNGGVFEETTEGTPQGGIISPTLCNIALNGLENTVKSIWPQKNGINSGVNIIRYADDIIVTGKNQTILKAVKEKIEEFLLKRGLALNQKKTRITNIQKGIDLLGFHLKRYPFRARLNNYNGQDTVLVVKPSNKGIQKLKEKIKESTNDQNRPLERIIRDLNPILRGWAEHKRISYHSQETFITLDHFIWTRMIRWAKRKSEGSKRMAINKWIVRSATRKWNWSAGKSTLINLAEIPIIKLSLLKLDKNPYLMADKEYFIKRKQGLITSKFHAAIYKKQKNLCPICDESLFNGEKIEMHHLKPQSKGGLYKLENCQALHRTCHVKVTHQT